MAILKSTPEVISKILAESVREVYKKALRDALHKMVQEEIEYIVAEKTRDLVINTQTYQHLDSGNIQVEVKINDCNK